MLLFHCFTVIASVLAWLTSVLETVGVVEFAFVADTVGCCVGEWEVVTASTEASLPFAVIFV